MKETPLLFTPENVSKVLDGDKTQTRRIIKPQPWEVIPPKAGEPPWPHVFRYKDGSTTYGDPFLMPCPYGTVGDRLYVKESHYLWGRWDLDGLTKTGRQKYRFRRTTTEIRYREDPPTKGYDGTRSTMRSQWHKRSALFMEKKDARLWLELTEVRVERLQEISEEDCRAEGVQVGGEEEGHDFHFMNLWESINGKGSWDLNPWVWVLSFKTVKP